MSDFLMRVSETAGITDTFTLLDNDSGSDGVEATFTPTTARYLRVRIYNDGRYGIGSFAELYNLKLFR